MPSCQAATGELRDWGHGNVSSQPTREVIPPVVTDGQPDQRQLMAGYCNAALRRRRK